MADKALHFTLGPIEQCPSEEFSDTQRDLLVNGEIFGFCSKVKDSKRTDYHNHEIRFLNKRVNNDLDLPGGTSYDELLKILDFRQEDIRNRLEVNNLEIPEYSEKDTEQKILGFSSEETEKILNLENAPRDAAGVILRPFTRITETDDKGQESLTGGTGKIYKTEDVLKYIAENDSWDEAIREGLKGKEQNSGSVLNCSTPYCLENGTVESHFPIATGNKDPMEGYEQVCETIAFSKDPTEKEMAISFIPNNLQTENIVSIHSVLHPVPVRHNLSDGTEVAPLHYPREELKRALKENGWAIRDARLIPTHVPSNKPEKLTPIRVKTNKGTRCHLRDHLYTGKIRNTVQEFINYNAQANTIENHFPMNSRDMAEQRQEMGTRRTQRTQATLQPEGMSR